MIRALHCLCSNHWSPKPTVAHKVAPTVAPINNEPKGIAWNPDNSDYYITNDDEQRIYDVNPGVDTLLGTADETWVYS